MTRRMNPLLALLVVGVAAGASLWVLHDLSVRPLTAVKVAGPFEHVSRAELRQVVADSVSHGFFGVDVDAVRADAASLPWVRSARVRRRWPGSVEIVIDERRAVARWGESDLLEADASVFTPDTTRGSGGLEGLPRLDGPDGQQARVLEAWRVLDSMLGGAGGPWGPVVSLRLTERGDWYARAQAGLDLVMDREPGSGLLARIAPSLPLILGERLVEVERIDMRYGQGFAVRWRSAPAAEGGES